MDVADEPPAAAIERVRAEVDPTRRGRMATELLATYRDLIDQVGPIRREAAQALLDEGWSYQEIANGFGVSAGRIMQIFERRAR